MSNPIDDALLHEYAQGRLDPHEARFVKSALEADPILRSRFENTAELRAKLKAAFDPILSEPVPTRLTALFRARSVLFAGWGRRFGSLAAALLIGLMLGQTSQFLAPRAPVGPGMMAQGNLASALQTAPSGLTADGTTRIGISFEAKNGQFCRSFLTRSNQSTALAGLACRNDQGWTVAALTPGDVEDLTRERMRAAATPLPLAVAAMVAQVLNGDALDLTRERAKIADGWKRVER